MLAEIDGDSLMLVKASSLKMPGADSDSEPSLTRTMRS
jgi:hypothetical protein